MTFQQIILTLQGYWAERGCVIVQPTDVETGAGTFNSATYLRALGPEPWSVAYVEPSRRPKDARYGENPNRVEKHHQFQVLLKPSPKDVQETYLGSLRAIGIDPLKHDIRFVEDNWESPTLGAWGLGWEVWFDGMEITQFTYFQQCGGYDLAPIAVELTYGLERIAMCLQNVENVYDLEWAPGVTYGQIRHAAEVQWSKHNFEQADIPTHLRWFEEYKSECLRLCEAGLVIPAYDYCLRCSHVFNILDARGAIGVTERQAYILRVRELAKVCADGWLALRKELDYPLMQSGTTLRDMHALDVPLSVTEPDGDAAAFLLELGTEEIPARMAHKAAKGLLSALQKELQDWGLTATGPHADCTPRRLAIGFDSMPLRQADREEVVKGPPTRIALDGDGNPTRAGEAFYKKLEDGDEVFKEGSGKGEYLMIRRKVTGRLVRDLLKEALPRIIGKLHWAKPMRWGTEKTPFVRPIHWICCALGGQPVTFNFADVVSGTKSQGHRFHAPTAFEATTWEQLETQLYDRKVVLSSEKRTRLIRSAVTTLADNAGGTAVIDEALLSEVTHIVEWPVATLGTFEEELLKLPREAIVTPMRVHQRYFPVEGADGNLLPCFVVVMGTAVEEPGLVARGNARVLRARLADARFFYESDLTKTLEDFLPKLETKIWLKKLGSVREKIDRLVALTAATGGDDNAQRAALLCKADLATEMVGEFAELQGTMGREYAAKQGEADEVASALFESYLPRNAEDALPSTAAGTWVALADRFDSIVGCFGIGLKPTGSKDPYALRRQAIAIINILTDTAHAVPLDITVWIDAAIAGYGDRIKSDCTDDIVAFFADRTRFLHRDTLPADVVDAVVAAGANTPRGVMDRIVALAKVKEAGELEPILTTFKRVSNITKDVEAVTFDASALTDDAGKALYATFNAQLGHMERGDGTFADALTALRPVVDTFFDEVLVMAEEPELRAARLGLLCTIRDTFATFADFSRIQDRK